MKPIRCRFCGVELGPRGRWEKLGVVLQLWYGFWYPDTNDGVWRKGKRRRTARFVRRGGDPPPREGYDWIHDPEFDEVYWRIWVDAEIECPSCGIRDTYSPEG